MIPAGVKTLIGLFPLGVVATVTSEGRPAASPKGTFLVLDDQTIAYGDIRSPGTRSNLDHMPELEVVFVDPFKRKGARLRGRTRVVERGASGFAELIGNWSSAWGDLADRIGALVIIEISTCLPLATPPYDDGATEADMIATYQAKYKEIYP
ncbi:MAG: pyridoxamine 5'-phosphate oxidase family protein [Litoreibacter sp.]|nr:pyridoxamine 5'-phosphate oxidase family protein [Litoreibacter sp.]